MNLLSDLKCLDNLLFDGNGIPGGNIVEIHGQSDSCKTGLALWFCRYATRTLRIPCSYICTEQTITSTNIEWADIDKTNLIVGRQTSEYCGLEICRDVLGSGIQLVVIDSIAALVEGSQGGEIRSILGKHLPSIGNLVRETESIVLLLNQERHSLGSSKTLPVARCPITTRLIDCRIELSTGLNIRKGPFIVGYRVHFNIGKNGPDTSRWNVGGRFNCYWQKGLTDMRTYSYE